jgi:proteic killer suppression protein
MTHHSSDFSRYRDKNTAQFAEGGRIKAFQSFEEQARKRLVILEEADSLRDLTLLPSNRFQALDGKRKGQYSIRINEQWRICFEWPEDHTEPFHIEIVDYH